MINTEDTKDIAKITFDQIKMQTLGRKLNAFEESLIKNGRFTRADLGF